MSAYHEDSNKSKFFSVARHESFMSHHRFVISLSFNRFYAQNTISPSNDRLPLLPRSILPQNCPLAFDFDIAIWDVEIHDHQLHPVLLRYDPWFHFHDPGLRASHFLLLALAIPLSTGCASLPRL